MVIKSSDRLSAVLNKKDMICSNLNDYNLSSLYPLLDELKVQMGELESIEVDETENNESLYSDIRYLEIEIERLEKLIGFIKDYIG